MALAFGIGFVFYDINVLYTVMTVKRKEQMIKIG